VQSTAHGRLSRLRLIAASIAIAVGTFGVAGWLANLLLLGGMASGLPPFHPLSALLLVVAGGSLAASGRPARLLALLQLLASIGALAIHGAAWLGVSIALAERLPPAEIALMLLVAGAALLLREARDPRLSWAAQIGALLIILNSFRALLGLLPLTGSEAPFVRSIADRSFHGAGAWTVLGLGILASRPDSGFMPLALSTEPAGRLLRWLALTGTALPLLAVLMIELAIWAGFPSTWPGFLTLAVGNLLIFYVTAATYGEADASRSQAERNLTRANAELEQLAAERTAALERDQRYQAALFACSQTLLPQADTPAAREKALGEALTHLLAATGASRVILTRNHGDEKQGLYAELVASAYGPGYEPSETMDALRRRPWRIPNFDLQATMGLGLPIAGDVDTLAVRFPEFRPVLEAMGVQTLLNLSLRVNERWWGSLSFHDCERVRRWEEQELLLLRTAAELIGGTLQRWHDEDDLRRVEQERLALERRLLETQHAESLGVLAQGVAHDFNNILAAILGHAELALLDIPAGSEAAASLDAIARGARRAAELTGQMLTYAGQGKLVSSAVDLSALARDVGELMRVALPYEIELRYELATLPSVPADETKVRQMLLNLVTNAAESIAASGAITLATGQEELGPAELKAALFSAATPGPACFIEVRDSGGGMDEATLARIFDPFFSTKFTGRGLGLPAVQGIVRAHRGALFVRSAPGAGASFRVYFPLAT
jgi:signal transduction histidine kinase